MLQDATDNIILVFGIAFIAYFAVRTLIVKPKKFWFSVFWLKSGVFFVLISILDAVTGTAATGMICVFALAFLVIICIGIVLIFCTALAEKENSIKADPEYIIVLGVFCPSEEFDVRVKTAFEYWKTHRSSGIICTGGLRHSGTECEAVSAYNYFIGSGVPADRLFYEASSGSTLENLQYSSRIINDPEADTVIITSDYHTLRTLIAARKSGYKKVRVMPAFFPGISRANYAVRELLHLPAMLFLKNTLAEEPSGRKHMSPDARIYLQTDPCLNKSAAWPKEEYPGTVHQYFKECGCLITSLYNMLSIYENNAFLSPWELNEALKKAGMFYPMANLELGRIHDILPVRYIGRIPYSYDVLAEHIDDPDEMFILIVDGIRSERHYVLALPDETEKIKVLDPLSGPGNIENYENIYTIICFHRIYQ